MRMLIGIPTFGKNGILDGMEVVECTYLPDKVTIGDDETIKITGRGVNELSELPKIVF